MKTIEEHNNEILKILLAASRTGIECPKCHRELEYINSVIIQTCNYPDKRQVRCQCGFSDYIFV